jgi:hypothetical protein
MTVCILDVWHPDDSALVNSHWVAEQTHEVLVEQRFEVQIVAGAIDRERIRSELITTHDGFAFFGHGRDHLLYARRDERERPIPLIDGIDVSLVAARWFHAFACRSGNTLAINALDAGIAAYLGYRVAVNVEWEPFQLPAEITVLLRELVTIATIRLALGERSTMALRRAVRDVAVRLCEAVDFHRDALELRHLMGLNAFANSMHQDLVLEGTEVRP